MRKHPTPPTFDTMRQARLKAPRHYAFAYYHCVSRVVDRTFRIHEAEKEMFVALMRMYETLCQVRVVTFCVLSNHFHVLVEVPRKPDVPLSQEDVLGIVRKAFGRSVEYSVRSEVEHLRKIGAHEAAQKIIDSFTARMWDISAFMKSLKQRFTQWFNKRHDRKGTIWEERYKSTLVEGGGPPLAMVAAYVDLNPVRARLVSDPKDYRWCGYAQAVAGVKAARAGIEVAARAQLGEVRAESGLLEHYRRLLFNWGITVKSNADGTKKGAISPEERRKVMESGGTLPVAAALRCKMRYFTDGAVIGGREFVNSIFKTQRRRFGPKRIDGARKVRGLETVDDEPVLYVLRDLRVDVFGES
ncbi:MAG: transposase [Verrucomicrobiaceae bacterium]|nr:transposase [Verrucomicrobiaceae bacterium]